MYFRKWSANVWTLFAAGSQRIKTSDVVNTLRLSEGCLNVSVFQLIKINSAQRLTNQ